MATTMGAPFRDDCRRREAEDLLRGLTGGFLIVIPLLYTMETWRIGGSISPLRALLLLGVAYGFNLGLVTWAGFRRREQGFHRPFADALEATALALAAAALVERFLPEEPPGVRLSVTVAADRAEFRDGAYLVPFAVANNGAKPAADVSVVFEVRDAETVLEESTATIPFLPVGAEEEGHLVTALDPATHDIVARVGTLLAP